jgi:hypothetical protein
MRAKSGGREEEKVMNESKEPQRGLYSGERG